MLQLKILKLRMATFGITAQAVCRSADKRSHASLCVPVGQRLRFFTDVFSLRLEKAFIPHEPKSITVKEASWTQHWWYFMTTPAVKLYYKG